jgi:hypothetical protein
MSLLEPKYKRFFGLRQFESLIYYFKCKFTYSRFAFCKDSISDNIYQLVIDIYHILVDLL